MGMDSNCSRMVSTISPERADQSSSGIMNPASNLRERWKLCAPTVSLKAGKRGHESNRRFTFNGPVVVIILLFPLIQIDCPLQYCNTNTHMNVKLIVHIDDTLLTALQL